MPAIPVPVRRAFSSGFALVLCGACATYVDEPPNMLALGSGGSGGEAGASGGSGAEAPLAGSGGKAPQAGSAAVSAGSGGAAGASAGGSGGAAAGAAGSNGGGGMGGAAGAGGKASGGAGGASGAGGKASGGAGGSGGTGQVRTCAAGPIPAKSTWTVTASHSEGAGPPANAHDGNLTNRWSTGKDQTGGEWLQIDLKGDVTLTELTLVLGASVNDYPRTYQVRFSNSAMITDTPVLVSGMGQASTDTVITFPKGTHGRYVRITQGGTAPALWWSVAEIQAECAD